jgi:CBS-domain-containing membrane protein
MAVLGIVMALIFPVRSYTVTTVQSGQFIGHTQQNVWFVQQLGLARAAAILATLLALAIVVTIAVLLHSAGRLPLDLAALWAATLLLVGTVYVTSTWANYLFWPTALVAVIAALVASIYQIVSSRPPRRPTSSDTNQDHGQ